MFSCYVQEPFALSLKTIPILLRNLLVAGASGVMGTFKSPNRTFWVNYVRKNDLREKIKDMDG
jgi:hypothetical protein